jgi:hypothetical protein
MKRFSGYLATYAKMSPEQRPRLSTFTHTSAEFKELVCANWINMLHNINQLTSEYRAEVEAM